MKNIFIQLQLICFLLAGITASPKAFAFTSGGEKVYKYDTVPNDPLKVRIYTLENGLKVYLSVYKDAPRIQTYIAIKAGSKNDPSDATGLAHYLEHMVFKGTDKYGTLDYAKEKPLLDQIENLYETYRKTKEDNARAKIYRQIDSLSGIAAKHAIANEYDKMVAAIGAKGSNAYTSVEQTVYTCDIPSNQLEKWLTIEAERFRKPVMRIFHTELEAVYEEKNRSLDSDDSKVWETLFANLFKNHQYGTQTTIGTIDHLKNPSIKKINEYYNTYYVPNNMAICLSGDLDPDKTIAMIDAKFNQLKPNPVPAFKPAEEVPIKAPVSQTVVGPDAESFVLGYRFKGANTKEADIVTLIDKILYNNTAGLIDLNLNQKQKALSAASYFIPYKDYSTHILLASPKEGQSLDELKNLLLAQVELVKKGEFPDWLLTAIVNDLKLQQIKNYENNSARADAMVNAFTTDIPWKDFTSMIDRLSKITKKEIVDFAKANYASNYVAVYKKTGEDPNAQKVIKPQITPVEVNREAKSAFFNDLEKIQSPATEPAFIDYNKDIQQLTLKNIPVIYKNNSENKTFDLFYVWDMGTNHNNKIDLALEYLRFLGTSDLSPEQLQQEFYKLGCTLNVFSSEDQVFVNLSGLSDNFTPAVTLFEKILTDNKPSQEALNNLVDDVLKKRQDAKLNKSTILWQGMYNYAMFGPKSPFTNILSEKELKALKPEDLTELVKSLPNYKHRVLYYGPTESKTLLTQLEKSHKTGAELKSLPEEKEFEEQTNNNTKVYVVDYDMKQAEIIMLSKGEPLNKKNFPQIAMFSEYFGGGMASVVFQTLRESKALAYSVSAKYQNPKTTTRSHYVMAYIGTQADKLPEAMAGMFELLTDLPESQNLFEASKEAIIQKIKTERITKSDVLFNYEKNRKLGFDYDYRKDIYAGVPAMTMNDIKKFHGDYLKNKKYNILVLGKKDGLDIKTLEKYGEVKYLTLTDIFGY